MEISRHTDPQLLQDLVLAVQDVLKDVATAVADFQPLLSATEELESSLSRVSQLPFSQMVEETQAFLRWLRDDHFTFVGYTEYDLVTCDGVQGLDENTGKRMGLFRLESSQGDANELDYDKRWLGKFDL